MLGDGVIIASALVYMGLLFGIASVSYTHLDVYKRQPLDHAVAGVPD